LPHQRLNSGKTAVAIGVEGLKATLGMGLSPGARLLTSKGLHLFKRHEAISIRVHRLLSCEFFLREVLNGDFAIAIIVHHGKATRDLGRRLRSLLSLN